MSKAILVAVIGAVGAILANIATVAFPLILQWGHFPPYADHRVYKQVVKDFPRLGNVLEDLLNKTETYYLSREVELEFAERQGGNLRILGVTRTRARNALDKELDYQHNISALSDTTDLYLKVTIGDITSKTYTAADLEAARKDSPGGVRETKIGWKVPKGAQFTIESGYVMTKPLNSQEAFASSRLLAGTLFVKVKKPKLQGLILDFQALSFSSLTDNRTDTDGNRHVELSGPVFPGQGVNVVWKVK